MPRRGGKHMVLVKGSEEAMTAFKLEVAKELGFNIKEQSDFKKLSTEQVGQIGGNMVRRIQAAGEFAIMKRHEAGETRLMPDEVLPRPEQIRDVTNTGKENAI